MPDHERLLAEIESFLKAHGMYATHFGRAAMNDVALVSRLRAGGDVHLKTADKIRKFMAEFKPPKKRKERPIGSAARARAVA